MARNSAAPQVPGETVTDSVEQPAVIAAVVTETPVTASAAPKVAQEETVAVPKSLLDAMQARLDALESGSKITRRGEVGEQLPTSESIDQSKLKSPVLTKDGWIVPDTFGSNPAQKAL